VTLRWNSAVLDVGSGSGHVLLEMSYAGFSDLTGVDPYIDGDRQLRPGLRILKRSLKDLRGTYDLIMMNHSFEHMEEPEGELREVARLLRPSASVLIRTPIAGKAAWREYGPDWVQLDPPRHVFVHSEKSIELIADRVGLVIREVRYDSTAFQFWASEQYRRGVPLQDPRSYLVNPKRSLFTPEQIASYEARAAELNTRCQGDQACFYLTLSHPPKA
jgi:SAM-dependent methyltransferase